MNRSVLELRLKKINFQFDELHLMIPSLTKIFAEPVAEIFLEINPKVTQIEFVFFFNSKKIIKNTINLNSKTLSFSEGNAEIEFLVIIQNIEESLQDCKNCYEKMKKEQILHFDEVCSPDYCNFNDILNENDRNQTNYIRYLENTIIGLKKKLKAFNLLKSQRITSSIASEHARTILENSKESYQKSLECYKSFLEDKEKSIFSYKKTKFGKTLKNDKKISDEKSVSEEKDEQEFNLQITELFKVKNSLENFESMALMIEQLKELNQAKDKNIFSLKIEFQSQLEEFSKIVDELENNNKEIIEENCFLTLKNLALTETVNKLNSQTEELLLEKINLQQKLLENKILSESFEKYSQKSPENVTEIIKNLQKQAED